MIDHNFVVFVTNLFTSQAMTASFVSSSVQLSSARSYAVQAVWTGATSAGASDVVYIDGSLDGSNWTTVSSTATNATSGSILVNVELPAYPYVRVGFTRSAAAAGTMTINIAGKA